MFTCSLLTTHTHTRTRLSRQNYTTIHPLSIKRFTLQSLAHRAASTYIITNGSLRGWCSIYAASSQSPTRSHTIQITRHYHRSRTNILVAIKPLLTMKTTTNACTEMLFPPTVSCMIDSSAIKSLLITIEAPFFKFLHLFKNKNWVRHNKISLKILKKGYFFILHLYSFLCNFVAYTSNSMAFFEVLNSLTCGTHKLNEFWEITIYEHFKLLKWFINVPCKCNKRMYTNIFLKSSISVSLEFIRLLDYATSPLNCDQR